VVSNRRNPASLANLDAGRHTKGRARYSYTVLARLTARMVRGKFTIAQLASDVGVSWGSARRWVLAMQAAKVIHVTEYLRSPNNRVTSRVYQWGKGEDVPKPVRLSPAAYHRQYRARRQTLEGAWRGVA
jgi:hypothetical protein